ncbi:MAG TPA: TonB-dependent receptor [Tepidisphaeraceae bacterium]|jgi:iron complex outermembrane receptor protein|nr:TonB-dependent receptor [Tepidisphaeraceae bacterium]
MRILRYLSIALLTPWIASAARAEPLDTEPSVAAPADVHAPATGSASAAAGMDDSPELMLFNDIPTVLAAGKREQTTREAAASISVITSDDIEMFNYESLAAALRNQRSFYLHTDGLNWFAGVRGFLRPGEYNSRILVTVDGRPTNDLLYGQSHLDRDFVVPMEAVQQIEVVRGPGSSLYGTNAVFGVVNLVTKNGSDINGVQVRLEGGTQDTGRASVLYGGELPGGWDVLASVTAYDSQGDRDIIYDGVNDAAHDYGHIRNSDAEGVGSAMIKARKGDLTVMLDYETRGVDNSAATYLATFSDPGKMRENRWNASLKYDHEIQPGQSVHGMVYYGHYGYEQDYIVPPQTPIPAYRYYTTGSDDWLGEEFHYDWQANKALHILAGADGRQSLYTHQRDYETPGGTILNVPASVNYWGIFIESEYKPADWLSLTAGARLDHEQRFGSNFSPRLAVIVTPTKEDAFKFLYGRAFRIPTIYELLYSDPGANDPNPNLRPEVIDTFEMVWERQFSDGWRTSLGGYIWKMKDAMDDYVDTAGDLQTRNGPTTWAHGVEAEIDRKWSNGASMRAYATFTRAEHDGDGLLDSPAWIVGAAVVLPVYKNKTFLSIEPQVVGKMKTDSGDYTQPTYLTNIVLTSRDIIAGWTFQAGAYNLFANDARMPRDGSFNQYEPTLNYPNTSFLVSLSRKF